MFLAMSGISGHCMLGSVEGCAQGVGSCSWACLTSRDTACWAVLKDVLRGLGPDPGHIWHLGTLSVGQC